MWYKSSLSFSVTALYFCCYVLKIVDEQPKIIILQALLVLKQLQLLLRVYFLSHGNPEKQASYYHHLHVSLVIASLELLKTGRYLRNFYIKFCTFTWTCDLA